jgi:hypothetical protein
MRIKKFNENFENNESQNNYYLLIKAGSKSFFDGKYKDGTTIFVPFTSKSEMFVNYDSKPLIYKTEQEAQKRKDLLLRQNNKLDISIEKL